MIETVYAPRLNNNDDVLTIDAVYVETGAEVEVGDILMAVETDKAVMDIEAETGGYILRIACSEGESVTVGTPLLWIGDSPDLDVPQNQTAGIKTETNTAPTIKALKLIKEKGLSLDDIPYDGPRLTEKDVRAFLESKPVEMRLESLTPVEQTMLQTVSRQKEEAVPAYLETMFDQAPWEEYARKVADQHRFLMDPLLGLMAFSLVRSVKDIPLINAVIMDNKKAFHPAVNLGFTMQVRERLYMLVVREADRMDEKTFLDTLGDLQRRAISRRLSVEETSGATLCFTSMAKQGVTRHIPVLAPRTSLIVAHSVPAIQLQAQGVGKIGILGATYDHRLLTGHHAASVLEHMTTPPD